MTSLAMGWPAPLRLFAARAGRQRLDGGVRGADDAWRAWSMWHSTWPSRSYLLSIAAKLALAWLVIRLVTSVIRNEFIVRLVSLSAWLVAALEHHRPARSRPSTRSNSVSVVLGGLRLTPLLLIKLGVLLVGGAVADQHRQQFRRKPDHAVRRSDAVDPGAAGQDDPAGADGICGRGGDERGRHQSLGAGDLLRCGRRRHRFRPAEDRRQFHQRHHPAGGQIGEARRSRHHRRQFGAHQRDEDALYFGRRRRRPRIPDPERGSGDAEGHQLDLYRQEHAGEGQFRHQLRRRSAAGLQARRPKSPPPRRAPPRASRRTAS